MSAESQDYEDIAYNMAEQQKTPTQHSGEEGRENSTSVNHNRCKYNKYYKFIVLSTQITFCIS